MQGEQVVLTDMLQCRERRAQIQDTFIEQYHCPVISFCMNIPGPVKTMNRSAPPLTVERICCF